MAVVVSTLSSAQSPSPASLSGGHLRQKVAVLVFMEPSRQKLSEMAEWIVAREIRAFEAFVWRYSGQRVLVETVKIDPGRGLSEKEFLYHGPRWGYQPKLGATIAADLERQGWTPLQFDGLVVLYEPPPTRPTPLAGVTYGLQGYSAIPLKDYTFSDAGKRYPLHLLLVHEFLHQMEQAFVATTGGPYLVSPDEGDLRTALRRNSNGSEIEWRMLSPALGSWISR